MKDFDAIKEMWQQQPVADVHKMDLVAVSRHAAGTKKKLKTQQARGVVMLCCHILPNFGYHVLSPLLIWHLPDSIL